MLLMPLYSWLTWNELMDSDNIWGKIRIRLISALQQYVTESNDHLSFTAVTLKTQNIKDKPSVAFKPDEAQNVNTTSVSTFALF
jgi:hypothetical protein